MSLTNLQRCADRKGKQFSRNCVKIARFPELRVTSFPATLVYIYEYTCTCSDQRNRTSYSYSYGGVEVSRGAMKKKDEASVVFFFDV